MTRISSRPIISLTIQRMQSSWSNLMPLSHWFDRCGSKQHGPDPITGPQRLVVNQQWHEWSRAVQERQKAHVEREGSVESRFAQFVPKLAEDGGKLRVHFLLIGSVEFGGISALGNTHGRRSSEKKSGLGGELVSVVD